MKGFFYFTLSTILWIIQAYGEYPPLKVYHSPKNDHFIKSLSLTESETTFLKSTQTLKVGVIPNKPPFCFMEGKDLKGYFIDSIESLFKDTGIKLIFLKHPDNYFRLRSKLKEGYFDLISYTPVLENAALSFGEKIGLKTDALVHNLHSGQINRTKMKKMKFWLSSHYNYTEHKGFIRNLLQIPISNYVSESKPILNSISSNKNEYTLIDIREYRYFKERYSYAFQNLTFFELNDSITNITKLPERELAYAYPQAGPLTDLINKIRHHHDPAVHKSISDRWFDHFKSNHKDDIIMTLNENESNYLKSFEQLRVGVRTNSDPFEFRQDNQFQGINIDILKLFSKSINKDIRFVAARSTKGKTDRTDSGDIDLSLIPGSFVGQSPHKADKLYSHRNYFITRYDFPQINNHEQLRGYSLGFHDNYDDRSLNSLKKIATVVKSNSYEDLFTKVSMNELDAIVTPHYLFTRMERIKPFDNLILNAYSNELSYLYTTNIVPYTTPQKKELIPIINKFIFEMRNGTLDKLKSKWFGDYQKVEDLKINATLSLSNDIPDLPGLDQDEILFLQSNKTLQCAILNQSMPFSRSRKSGEMEGIFIDVLNKIESKIGLKINFIPVSTQKEALKLVESRQVDFTGLTFVPTSSRNKLRVSSPLNYYEYYILSKETSHSDIKSLSGKKVGIPPQHTQSPFTKKNYPGVEFIEIRSPEEGLKKVSTSEIDAYINIEPVLKYYMRRHAHHHYVLGKALPLKVDLVLASSKENNPALFSILSKAYRQLTSEEKLVIQDKWYSIKIEEVTDYTMLWVVSGFTGTLILFFIYWNGKLSKLNTIIQEKEALARSLIESTNGVIFKIDLINEKFTYMAPQIRKFGYAQNEFNLFEDFHKVVHPEDLDNMIKTRTEALSEKKQEYTSEFRVKNKSGDYIWTRVLISITYDKNTPISSQGILLDITNEKSHELAIQTAKDAAESANRAKSQFLANMSHEIRTPLNPIIGLTHLALNANASFTQVKEYLSKIQISSKSLLRIINDILDLSKMEAEKLNLEKIPCDLSQLNERIKSLYGVKASEKNIDILFEIDQNVHTFVISDPIRMEQIIGNLVSNAIKFTDEGYVKVVIKLVSSSEKSQNLYFGILDTGLGIPENKLDKIFELFTQADDSNTRTHGGTGLGLNICQKLIHLMSGELKAKSTVGKGSEFYFSLNLDKVDENIFLDHQSTSFSKNQFPKFKKTKILLAEDNPINKQVAEELLKAVNLEVTHVNNGKECIEAIHRGNFELVLSDIQMPVMDGFEATRKIRADQRFKDLPIIAMTAQAFASEKKAALDAGMNAHVTKPIEPNKLYETLAKFLSIEEVLQDAEEDLVNEDTNSIDIELLDYDSGIRRLRGNSTLYREIILEFHDSYKQFILQLESYLKKKDFKSAQSDLHQLKGSAANIGAYQLQQKANTLEMNLKNEQQSEHELQQFKHCLNLTLSTISDYTKVFTAEEHIHQTNQLEEFSFYYKSLQKELSEASPNAKTTIGILIQHAKPFQKNDLLKIKNDIDDFNFDKAQIKLKQFIQML